MAHLLHREIGRFLKEVWRPEDGDLLLAPECGGKHNLPLFCSATKGNDSEYCNVDAMVVKDRKIHFLLEIEESGLTPTKIFGKFFASALSKHFIHGTFKNTATPMADKAAFVQVIDAIKLKPKSKKLAQAKSIEQSIQRILPIPGSGLSSYRLFSFRGPEDFRLNHEKRLGLKEAYMQACASARPGDAGRSAPPHNSPR